jgi:hypothetical protein
MVDHPAWQGQFQAAGYDIDLNTLVEPALHALSPDPPVYS